MFTSKTLGVANLRLESYLPEKNVIFKIGEKAKY